MKFEISPHPKAPMFSGDTDSQLKIVHAMQEMANLQTTEKVRDLLRQVCFVNLWFFQKFVIGYSQSPFEFLNTSLHLDMCNFAQRMSKDGVWAAVFEPRWHFKTTVFSIGLDAHDLLREPEDMAIGIFHAVYDKALDILHAIQRIFDSNELFEWLFPEYVPPPRQKRWNDEEMVLPTTIKPRWSKDPSARCGSVGSTSQGMHFKKINLDDIVGESDLDAGRAGGIDMERKAIYLYGQGARESTNPAVRNTYEYLVDQETEHYQQLKDNWEKLAGIPFGGV